MSSRAHRQDCEPLWVVHEPPVWAAASIRDYEEAMTGLREFEEPLVGLPLIPEPTGEKRRTYQRPVAPQPSRRSAQYWDRRARQRWGREEDEPFAWSDAYIKQFPIIDAAPDRRLAWVVKLDGVDVVLYPGDFGWYRVASNG